MGSRQLTPAVEVRPATTADAARLLAWANDPDTRAASFRSSPISPNEHAAWLARTLTLPTRRLLIGMLGDDPIGQVRLDVTAPGEAEVGISIAPERRGQGLGAGLLAAAVESGRRDPALTVERFIARVRVENQASIRLFERAGFVLRETGTCQGEPCLIFVLPPVTAADGVGVAVRFARTADDVGEATPGEPTNWLILDPAWSPRDGDNDDLVAVRQVTERVLAREDLFPATTRLLDDWADQTGIAEALTVDGTSFWYRRRLWAWRWLHERLIWIGILDELTHSRMIAAIDPAPPGEAALADVVRLFAARAAIPVRGRESAIDAGARDATDDEIAVDLGERQVGDGGETATGQARHPLLRLLRDVIRRTRVLPADRRRARTLARRAAMDQRAATFASEAGRLLVVADPATYQNVATPTGPARIDPFLGPIVERLALTAIAPILLELGTRAADDETWARTTAPAGARILTADLLARRFASPEDGPAAAAAATRVAADVARRQGSLEVAGLDLGPALLAGLERYARIVLPAGLREVARERRLLEALRPAAVLTVDEYGRTEWLSAARQAGIPVVAVQHGIIHPWHPGYQHRTRPAVRAVPQRTYAFGEFERRLLLEAGGYRPEEVVVAGSPRLDLVVASGPSAEGAARLRTELDVAAGERLLVISTTFADLFRRFYTPVALASLIGRRIDGVRVVIKLHPGEQDGDPYLRLLDGLRGSGEPPRTDVRVVKDVDLYRLLAAADAHLGLYSTVLTEAVVVGTRNLLATTQAASDLLGYVPAGVAQPVRTADELETALIAGASPDPDRRAAFLADHFMPGTAAQRIADDLVAWLGATADRSVRVR